LGLATTLAGHLRGSNLADALSRHSERSEESLFLHVMLARSISFRFMP